MPSFAERVKSGWNAFFNNRDPTQEEYFVAPKVYDNIGSGNSYRPDRLRLTRGNERSFITAILNRLAVDIASIDIRHVRLDQNGRYIETIDDDLNRIFNLSANLDQTGYAFRLDAVLSLFDEGCVAIVPMSADRDPVKDSFVPYTARVGQIVEWFPKHIRVRLYNEYTGLRQDVVMPKAVCCIVENPFYAVMNEPNSTFKRLIRKLNTLDILDGQSTSGKLDLIVQLPYVVKTEARRTQAENRRKDLEMQLSSSKYGIAYTDSTERITQLNRSLENNLLPQIEYLTKQLMSQLGLTEEIMNGTASADAMTNYYSRICEPVLNAFVSEYRRKWLTQTARTQGQDVMFFRDPFKLVPVEKIADFADRFTRNEILSSNEIRGIVGFKPSDQPGADDLRNKNLNQSDAQLEGAIPSEQYEEGVDPYAEEG